MSRRIRLLAVSMLLVMFALEVFSSRQESQTIDEAVHLSSGYSYWKTGDFRMNPEHPPLIKMLAAFPLLFSGATLPLADASWQRTAQWDFGEKFLYENKFSPDTLLLLGRLPIMLVSIVLGWLIFAESRKMYGSAGGFISLGFYAFDPNIIAHSRLVTTDLGFSALAFFSLIRLRVLFEKPTKKNVIWFCSVLLLACLTKFSFLGFFVALGVTFVVLKFREPNHSAVRFRTIGKTFLISVPISLLAIWVLYGFDIRRPIDDPRIAQLYEQRENALANNLLEGRGGLEKFVVINLGDRSQGIGKLAEKLTHYPYPMYTFFRGAINVIGHSVAGQTSFLLGEERDRGWWQYFPVAFAAKTPVVTMLAFAGTLVTFLFLVQRKGTFDRRWILFGVPPLAYFVISLFSHLNLGWRHIMPIYPSLLVLAGVLATIPFGWRHGRTVLVTVVLCAAVFTQLKTYPNEIGYFNFLFGGSTNGHTVLRDSNLDWGQNLPKLRAYVEEHNIDAIAVEYYGSARVNAYVPVVPLDDADYFAISAERLYALDGSYRWLHTKDPVAILGSTMYVYDVRK